MKIFKWSGVIMAILGFFGICDFISIWLDNFNHITKDQFLVGTGITWYWLFRDYKL